jgi:adducin
MAYTKQEKFTRCKLAAIYRLIDMYGWTQGIYNHVTVRLDKYTSHCILFIQAHFGQYNKSSED